LALGLLYVFATITYFSDSNLSTLDTIKVRDSLDPSISTAALILVTLGFCYLYGSMALAIGEFWALEGFHRDSAAGRVSLATRVFETGNGLLIALHEEARKQAQIFGGVAFTFVSSLLTVGLVTTVSRAFGLERLDGNRTGAAPFDIQWWPLLQALAIGAVISMIIFRTVRKMTSRTLMAIELEADRILSERASNPTPQLQYEED
jgi:hypothetical protein